MSVLIGVYKRKSTVSRVSLQRTNTFCFISMSWTAWLVPCKTCSSTGGLDWNTTRSRLCRVHAWWIQSSSDHSKEQGQFYKSMPIAKAKPTTTKFGPPQQWSGDSAKDRRGGLVGLAMMRSATEIPNVWTEFLLLICQARDLICKWVTTTRSPCVCVCV
jgi:hypothetical protein